MNGPEAKSLRLNQATLTSTAQDRTAVGELLGHNGGYRGVCLIAPPAEITIAVNALVGRDVIFKLGDRTLPFTAEGFLMSFSLPNFFVVREECFRG
jgi:hypothetical protein